MPKFVQYYKSKDEPEKETHAKENKNNSESINRTEADNPIERYNFQRYEDTNR
jgi:hypothetical protein